MTLGNGPEDIPVRVEADAPVPPNSVLSGT
jgi:hypothetical protein